MSYRGGAIGSPGSAGKGSAGGGEAQGTVERGMGSVSAPGRKEERDRDRPSGGEAVV
jgi:hypothetical protein